MGGTKEYNYDNCTRSYSVAIFFYSEYVFVDNHKIKDGANQNIQPFTEYISYHNYTKIALLHIDRNN